MAGDVPTLTLQDIADLARVQRPVVSMWRNRPLARGRRVPFPVSVESTGGVERFRRADVVAWLTETGRGNNVEFALDAPALSMPDGASLEDLVTLLCLHTASGEELAGTTVQQRGVLADSADPRDQFIAREVRAMSCGPGALEYIDDLVEASFGPGEALVRLETGRLARQLGIRDLTTEAVDLVRTVARSCMLHLESDGVSLVESGETTAASLAVAGHFAELVIPGDSVGQRALRRRALLAGIEVSAEIGDGPQVRLLSVLGLDSDGSLQQLDEVVLQLGPNQLAVVLGPASLLCDELLGDEERARSQTLRSDSLAMALRLPRGMWRQAHRQALGIWVCIGGIPMRRPLVGDLGAFAHHELQLGDLAADVSAALGRSGARAFRYLRQHGLELIQSTRTVVPRGARAVRLVTAASASYLDRIQAATLTTVEPVPGFDVLVEPATGSIVLRQRSLGELRDGKQLTVKRGSRIDAALTDPAGTVPVLSAVEGANDLRLDPFDAAQRYPHANRTELGDVVFVERPRPKARVDDRGGSLVASPSRILRLAAGAGLGPHALAAIINQLPDEAVEWQAWQVAVLERDEAEQLERTLLRLTGYEMELRRRLDAVSEMTTALIDGVAAGAVALSTSEQEGH